MKINYLGAFLIVSLIAGCSTSSTIVSEASLTNRTCAYPHESSGSKRCVGLAYSVPRQLIKITVTGVTDTDEEREKALEKAKTAAAAAKADQQKYDLEAKVCPDSDKSADCVQRRSYRDRMKAATAAADAKVKAAEQAVRDKDDTRKDTITLAALAAEPDPKYRFFARFDHAATRDDVWGLGTTKEGLLTSAKSQPTDRSADILLKGVALATDIVAIQKGRPIAAENEATCPANFSVEYKIDVADFVNWEKTTDDIRYASPKDGLENDLNIKLKEEFCSNLRIGVRRDWTSNPVETLVATPVALPQAGLLYRRPLPYEFVVLKKIRNSFEPIQRLSATLPNEAPFQVVALPSAPLIGVTQNVTFEDGFPKQLDMTRGSEALAAVALPVTILGYIIDQSIGRIFKVQVNYDSAKEQALKSEKAVYDAQLGAIESKEKLDAKLKATADAE